jgi:ankyrin repeat protein
VVSAHLGKGADLQQRNLLTNAIQVLQEVGAARHVLIMCGSTVIDGYAFCLGLQSLNLSYESCPDLQNLIRSVTYLIRDSIFRPKYATSLSGEVSLGTHPLGELIEMYHTREATDCRDKIFALLGMSSDDPSAAGLLPNYKISWGELLEQLVRFLLGEQVSVKTWVHREMAVIKSKGCILGKVFSVDADHDDRQRVVITSKDAAGHLGPERKWTLQPSAKSVQVNDIVCFLHGAPKSTIIRLCKDHFVVVMIAVASLEDIGTESTSVRQPEQPIASFPHDFLLVWDWERSQGKSQSGEEYETWVKSRVPNHSRTELKLSTTKQGNHSDKLTRLRNVTLILEEAEAEEGLRETMEGCERAFGKEHLHTLTLMDKLALIYRRKEQWREAEELLEQAIQTRRRVQGTDHADTLSSMDNLAATYRDHGRCTKAKLVARTDIFSREGDCSQITKEGVVQIARSFDEEEMRILLEQRAYVNAQGGIFGTAIQAALAKGEEVIVIMLLEKGVDINAQGGIFGNALPAASAKGKEEIIATLLAKGADVNAQGRIFGNALYTATGGDFMTILLENGAGVATFIAHGNTNLECGAALLWAARNGHENVVKLLLEKGADVNAKARLGKRALLRMRFIIEPGSFNIECEMTALLWAARNGYESIVRLLLENRADVAARTCSGETALLSAALKGHEGVVRLLLEYGADVSVKDIGGRTALDLAASKGHVAVVRLLLEKELNVNMEAKFEVKALQIDREHIRMLEINGGFFHLTVSRGGATLQIERLKMNCGFFHLTIFGGGATLQIKRLKMNGGFFHLTVDGGGATLLIESLEMNGGSFHSKARGGRAKLQIGSLKMNDGSFHSKAIGGSATLQIGSLEMNGGSFRPNAKGESATLQIGNLEMNGGSFRSKASVVQIRSLKLNGGSVKPIKRKATHRAGEEEVIVLPENQCVNTEGGLTALYLAAENGHEAVVQLFLEKGANVNARWGKLTALYLAAHNYHNAMVQLLVENGADVDAEDDDTKRFVRGCLEKARPDANDALIQLGGTSWPPWRSSFDWLGKTSGRHGSLMPGSTGWRTEECSPIWTS